MLRIGSWTTAALAVLALGACDGGKKPADGQVGTPPVAGAVTPVPLPTGPNFPVPTATINGWIAAGDTASIRGHAWSLWESMGAPSGQYLNGQQLPIWDTWADTTVVFPQPQATNVALGADASKAPAAPAGGRKFLRPAQFHHTRDARLKALATAAADNFPLAVDSKYDPQAATFITSQQPGPGGGVYTYNSGASLTKLNASWPKDTTPQNRGINEFPTQAIETKPVFGLIKANGLTAQPLWQGPSASTDSTNPTPDKWTTCVLVQPGASGPVRPATSAEVSGAAAGVQAEGLACQTYLWAPLSTFYSAKLTAAEAQSFNAATGGSAVAGDYTVLLAMHVNTKEIPFWTWQTYWWQPGADTPNGFPGSKQGQPGSLGAPWNNYAACTAYDQTTTPGGTTIQVCFNPYLETSPGIPAGITSNCMSCHGVAVIGPNPIYPADYKKPVAFFTDPTYFSTQTTHTDFSWAVAGAP